MSNKVEKEDYTEQPEKIVLTSTIPLEELGQYWLLWISSADCKV